MDAVGQPFASLVDARDALASGAISTSELVGLAQADADLLDPLLGVYLTRLDEQANDAAARLDRLPAASRGPLHGLPVAVKDNIAVSGAPTTAQSQAYDAGWWQGRDAPVVDLLRHAGAVVLGKTSMAEYAIGRPDPAHPLPVPRNPWDPERWPGGSSAGNGAGLASGLFLGALGTDTSGSLRLPAAFCGVTGLKPTYGALPTDGVLPLSASMDVVGPMGVSAADCALLWSVLHGTGSPVPSRGDLPGLRVGVPWDLLERSEFQPACRSAFTDAVAVLTQAGAELVDLPLPELAALQAQCGITMLAEAFGAHRRRLAEHWADHGRPFRRLVAVGGVIPAHLYLAVQDARRATRAAVLERLDTADGAGPVDLVAMPTWPHAARLYADEAMPRDGLNITSAWNPPGLPALAVPMGVDDEEMPLSLQLVARPGSEDLILSVGAAFQMRTDWHLRRARPDPARAATPLTDVEPEPPDPSAAAAAVGYLLTAAGLDLEPGELRRVAAIAERMLATPLEAPAAAAARR